MSSCIILLSIISSTFAISNNGFLNFDDLSGEKFTGREVVSIMEFAQRRIADQLALAATGKEVENLVETFNKIKEEIMSDRVDKQVPKIVQPIPHVDVDIAKPQNPQFSPQHLPIIIIPNIDTANLTIEKPLSDQEINDTIKSLSKPTIQFSSKPNLQEHISYVRIDPVERSTPKPLSLSGPLPPNTEPATNLWQDMPHMDAKHDVHPKISNQNVIVDGKNSNPNVAPRLSTYFPKPQPQHSFTKPSNLASKTTTRPTTTTTTNPPYEINFCDQREFPEAVLKRYGLDRIENFVYNTSCDQRFFICAIGRTFSKKCQSDELVFDPNAVSCNYRNLVGSDCRLVPTTTIASSEEDFHESDFMSAPLHPDMPPVLPIR